MSYIVQAGVVAIMAIATGAVTMNAMRDDSPDLEIPDVAWASGSALDGRVFHTVDTIRETGEVLQDTLMFRDGRFQSEKCQAYCDFGWSDYRTWQDGGSVHFTATTACPDAPHSVVWVGAVEDGTLRFEATWTTRRWYWTRQVNATGEGTEAPLSDPLPSG